MGRVLIVDDDAGILAALQDLIGGQHHEVFTARCAESALEQIESLAPDLVVMDVWLPGIDGLEAFRCIRKIKSGLPVIVITGEGTTELAIEAARLGAFDYLIKPIDPEPFLAIAARALSACAPDGAEVCPSEGRPASGTLIGCSPPMQELYKAIGRAAATDATVLIRGETGTGKELVAHAIHQHSRRRRGPFVAVNCVAIPESLLESELFGHERGAFTGADNRRIGRFEQADGGTLLLDEIGDMPAGVQAKLLRVLQDRAFERIGGNEKRRVEVRVVAATNCHLERAITQGRFRQDLYHRVNLFAIHVPPLRERREDIPLLADCFVEGAAFELGCARPSVAADAMEALMSYEWPGNVRELEHCLRRIVIWNLGATIRHEDVCRALSEMTENADEDAEAMLRKVVTQCLSNHPGSVHRRLSELTERLLVAEALRRTAGNQSRAARLLGLPRTTLHAHLHRHEDVARDRTPDDGVSDHGTTRQPAGTRSHAAIGVRSASQRR